MNILLQPRKNHNKDKWLKLAKDNNLSFEIEELAYPMNKLKAFDLINYYKNTGLVTSMHGAFIDVNPASNDPKIADISIKRLNESCIIAKRLGAKSIVFHSSAFPFLRGSYLDTWAKRSADVYCNLARKYKLNIYIENSMDVDPEAIYRLMRQCEVPYVRTCLDFGHVNYSREPFETWIDVLGKDIGYVHLSDNMGSFDDHLAIGKGIMPWDIVDDILSKFDDNINVTLETGDYISTENSINYLKENNLILHLNNPFKPSYNGEYFDISTNKNIKEYTLGEEAKLAIEKRKRKIREQKYAKRNEVMQNIFSKYLSNEIVHRALEHPETLELGGKKKKLTMMMTDLHGFTQMSENLHAEELIKVLNNYFKNMMEVLHRYHGTILDIAGDGMLVAFGMFDDEDHADKAVAAAMEMQIKMDDVNLWNKENGYSNIHMGIGIHTGNVVVGNIGSDIHVKYGIVGSNVNKCSRIESYTYNGQILISSATKDECKSSLTILTDETVYPKGLKTAIKLYHPVEIKGNYNIKFYPRKLDYQELTNPKPIEYNLVHSKHNETLAHSGFVLKLSETGAIIKTDETLDIHDNIFVDIGEPLFCKIVNMIEGNVWEVSFTSIPPSFENWMHKSLKNNTK